MIQLLKEFENFLRQQRTLSQKEYLVFNMLSDGSGLVLRRSTIRGIIRESLIFEYDNLAQVSIIISNLMGKDK